MDTKSTHNATELKDAPTPRTASDHLGVIGVIAGVLLLIGLVAAAVVVAAEERGVAPASLVNLRDADGKGLQAGDVAPVTSDDEPGQQTGLDRGNVEAAMAAALAEVDGNVIAISVDDDSIRDAYSVDVLTSGNGGVVEVELDRNFRVTHTESDPEEDTASVDAS